MKRMIEEIKKEIMRNKGIINSEILIEDEDIFLTRIEIYERCLQLAKQEKEKIDEEFLAICQMWTLNDVLSGGGMDIDTALELYGFNNKESFELAKKENIDFIADKIKSIIEK